ncbi:MAG: class I SAM-dependent methyltransferase [Roseibium sp.]
MTALKDKIKARIAVDGPISVAQYMSICLSDPEYGYYTTRDPFGEKGDFITAPEVSQMFGELIGAVCMGGYAAISNPEHFELVELGPGRGTLMADFLRMAALNDDFINAAHLNFVEMSPRLRDIQTRTLSKAPLQPGFLEHFQDVPDKPIILIANEFFDALPIHQFVKTQDGWLERQVGLSDTGDLTFGLGSARLPDTSVPADAKSSPDGTILETQPAANAIAETIGAHLAKHGGIALLIDYGYSKSAPGDTLQALYRHTFDDPLSNPGNADLTAHVNFEALAAAATKSGAIALPLLEQGEFLLRSGLLERAGRLGSGKSRQQQETIHEAVERLAGPDQMGQLFKVLAITGGDVVLPPFDIQG